MTAAALRVEDLVVSLGGRNVLDGVSFAVAPGEVYGLLGPNGAGKTTTVRVLTTLQPPGSGAVRVAGFDVERESGRVRAAIGYVPQSASADPRLTVRENLEFYARATGVARAHRRARIAEALETMGLEAVADSLAGRLSGGLCRRLEIGTALLGHPAVLVLDEPTAGLDPNARAAVWECLGSLRAGATAILVTTHIMPEAESHCDRLAILQDGRMLEEGEPAAVMGRVGSSNLDEVFRTLTGGAFAELDEAAVQDAGELGRFVA